MNLEDDGLSVTSVEVLDGPLRDEDDDGLNRFLGLEPDDGCSFSAATTSAV